MSQWAHEHPEDPEGAWEALLEAGDQLRKERRENPELWEIRRELDLAPECLNEDEGFLKP